MLDPREHCPESIDMAHIGIQVGVERGVMRRDAAHPHLVQVMPVSWP
jgi:hypothetical protein